MVLLFISGFGLKTQAQISQIDVDNQIGSSGCDWTITAYNSSNTILATINSTNNSGILSSGCLTGLDHIVIDGPNLCNPIPYGSGGSFSTTSWGTSCSSCATGMKATVSSTINSCSVDPIMYIYMSWCPPTCD